MPRPLLLALLLCACASLDPGTLARLSAVSPIEADPAGFALALDLPEGLGLRDPPGAIGLAARRDDTGARVEGTYALRLAADGLLAVDPRDLARLRADQRRIAAWEAEADGAAAGSLTVALGLCRAGDGPAPEARVSVGLRTAPGGPLLPLVREGRVAEVASEADAARLPPCP